MIKMRTQGYSLANICTYVGISRQSYHKQISKQDAKEQLYQEAEQFVITNRAVKSRVGLRCIYYKENLSTLLGINQFERQMSALGYALKPYRSRFKTTDSRGQYYKFNNLISGLNLQKENHVIVGDITYYQNARKLYYIFQFQDYYTMEIKGLIGSLTMEGINAEKCLRQVFNYNCQRKYNYKLILHTDRGTQYRSRKFQLMLRQAQIRPSHAGNCFENGLSERTNGILKNEYLTDYDIRSVSQLNSVLKKIKHQINEVWPSKILGYKTPKQFAKWTREQKEAARPIRTVKIVK